MSTIGPACQRAFVPETDETAEMYSEQAMQKHIQARRSLRVHIPLCIWGKHT